MIALANPTYHAPPSLPSHHQHDEAVVKEIVLIADVQQGASVVNPRILIAVKTGAAEHVVRCAVMFTFVGTEVNTARKNEFFWRIHAVKPRASRTKNGC